MIDITLDNKERAVLKLEHPYGASGRNLITNAKADLELLDRLVERGLHERYQPGLYRLTDTGRQASGVLT